MKVLTIFSFCIILSYPVTSQKLFTDVANDEGVQIRHIAFESSNKSYSTGAVWFDFDNDGDLDLFVTNPSDNRLFRNNRIGTGETSFTDITSGDARGYGRGGSAVVAADYDNDGDEDLYLANRDADILLRNDGNGNFTDVTKEAFPDVHELVPEVGTTIAWGDINNDGWLDLYVGNHTNGNFSTSSQDYLFVSNGDNPVTFTDRSELLDYDIDGDRVGDLEGFNNATAITDFNKDGLLDIYTANDCPYGPEENKLWMNLGDLDFIECSESVGPFQRGVFSPDCFAAMGIARGDPNQDGFLDYHMSSICFNGENTVLLQNDGKTLINVSGPAGLDENIFIPESGILFTWGTVFVDYDLDTWQDLIVGGGSMRDVYQPNFLYQNITPFAGDTPRFKEVDRTKTGLDNGESARTVIMGDYDMDGDPDIYLCNLNGTSLLYRNNNDNGNHWLQIKTEGAGPPLSNRNGIGAKLTLTSPDRVRQYYEIYSGSGLGGGDDMAAYFGLGQQVAAELEILWPSGIRQRIGKLNAGIRTTLKEPKVKVETPSGGEILRSQESYPISWVAAFREPVDILLIRDNLTEDTIGTGINNTGTFLWQIPGDFPGDDGYAILIRNSSDTTQSGISYPSFSVAGPSSVYANTFSANDDKIPANEKEYQSSDPIQAQIYSHQPDVSVEVRTGVIFPNPVNTNGTLQIYMPVKGPVYIYIHDLSGRKAKHLISAELNSGKQSINFDVSDLSPGLYFCSWATDGNPPELRKIVITD